MIRLQWNALRIGHEVLVHDDAVAGAPLVGGHVTMIQTRPGANEVAIRLTPVDGASTVVNPARLTVHLVPLDDADDCWRCLAATSAG